MADQKDNTLVEEMNQKTDTKQQLSQTWPDDALADLADYIEEQGVYIRQ